MSLGGGTIVWLDAENIITWIQLFKIITKFFEHSASKQSTKIKQVQST